MENNRLGYEEFREVLFDLTSAYILPDDFINSNEDFIDNLVFDMWQEYNSALIENTVRHYSKLLEIFFYNYFKFKL